MGNYIWYELLTKPSWAPTPSVFGPVWSVLYIIIILTFGWVFIQALKGTIPRKVMVPFILNLIFNFLFTPIQFGLKNNLLAAVDIVLVLLTILWMFIMIWKYSKKIVYLNIPYFLWVSFATILQFTITYLNWS